MKLVNTVLQRKENSSLARWTQQAGQASGLVFGSLCYFALGEITEKFVLVAVG